jgi:hypothetical protein
LVEAIALNGDCLWKIIDNLATECEMKRLLLVIMVMAIHGCSEKKEYAEAVLEEMKAEKDIKDYKIEPEKIRDCVVETSAQKMPGLGAIDPSRRLAYKNYTKMLQIKSSSDPKKSLEELRAEFGSAKNLADAHANYIESMLACMENLIGMTEQDLQKEEGIKKDNKQITEQQETKQIQK